MKTYHVAYTRGIPSGPCCNRRKSDTLIVECASEVDYLSPDVWQYLGIMNTTKTVLRQYRYEILKEANRMRPASWPEFKRVVIA